MKSVIRRTLHFSEFKIKFLSLYSVIQFHAHLRFYANKALINQEGDAATPKYHYFIDFIDSHG